MVCSACGVVGSGARVPYVGGGAGAGVGTGSGAWSAGVGVAKYEDVPTVPGGGGAGASELALGGRPLFRPFTGGGVTELDQCPTLARYAVAVLIQRSCLLKNNSTTY